MALRVAVNSGSWSNSATWLDGVFPDPGDIICSNGFVVNIDQDINVDYLANTAVNNPGTTTIMTSNTTPAGYIVSASTQAGSYLAYLAFDGSESNWWETSTSALPQWIYYKFPTSKTIDRYAFRVSTGGTKPTNWEFQVSNDGVSWTPLETKTASAPADNSWYYSPLLGNTTSYTYYRINITAPTNTVLRIGEIRLYETGSSIISSSAGGSFILNDGATATCTSTSAGIRAGALTCLNYSGSVSASLNAIVIGATSTSITALTHTGTGTLNISGSITSNAVTNTVITLASPGRLNIIGNVSGLVTSPTNCNCLFINNANAVVSIIGNVLGAGTQKQIITLNNGTLNITGNISVFDSTANSINAINTTAGTLNITGNLIMNNMVGGSDLVSYCVSNGSNCTFTLTGNIIGDNAVTNIRQSYNCANAGRFNQVGYIQANRLYPSFISTSTTAINILTGPFISSPYGIAPFQVFRMHYRPTSGSYYEFRDNSTNGALSPGAIASASYLYAPSTVIAAPNQNDVRFGTVYASGSQTGQMRVPLPSQVSIGIPVDNTVGTAVLSTNDVINTVWNSSITELTASNSIGNRLKNVSTPDITANQIIGLI